MSKRRTLNSFLNRRKSLIVKLILILPITWIIVTTLLSFSDKMNNEVIVEAPNLGEDIGDKYEGRKPRQSIEEQQQPNWHFDPEPKIDKQHKKHHQVHQDSNQELAVLAVPGDRKYDGPGEQGKPVILTNLTAEQDALVKEGWELNAFNQYVSDIISLHRYLPDVRSRGQSYTIRSSKEAIESRTLLKQEKFSLRCQEEKFDDDLPPTSVIVCFHNEAWSVLMRTVHSILDRSPPKLIEEIILVDDFSDLPHLGKQLEDYIVHIPKVKVVRAKRREGLIRARLLGASVSKAPILTYLDSHCECAHGWLEPLLQRIANNWTTVVCPVIDVIDDDTFEYHFRESGEVNVGGFDWNLQFNWHAMPEREIQRRKHSWEPVWSPTMAGGLFSINKKFFERLGTYDSGFDIWGGENLELSFKTWMCGGSLEILPCSHVGHIFRKRSPYKWKTGVNVLRKNSVRLAEVWLDEYKQYYYDRIGNDLGDYGDVTSRKELRKRLNCKSFDWYMKNIYPELFVPGDALGQGEIRNLGDGGDTCLDSAAKPADFHKPIGLWPCHNQGGNQYFMFSKEGEIKRDDACLDYAGGEVILYPCHGSGGNQMWIYDPNLHTIQHGSSRKCMELSANKESVTMAECDGSERQKWLVENYDPTKLSKTEPESAH